MVEDHLEVKLAFQARKVVMVPVPNPWLERRVLAYAHQGGALEAPSSTLLAMRLAVEAGADALELDVHATRDGHLVVCHDSSVDATTNGSGAIACMTLDEIRLLDNAYWFVPEIGAVRGHEPEEYVLRGRAPEDEDLCVPTLEEVLERFENVTLNLDIKQTAPDITPYEDALASLLARYGRSDDVIVASFHDVATEAFGRAAPTIATSAGTIESTAFWRASRGLTRPPAMRHSVLQMPSRLGGMRVVDERFVRFAHDNGLGVHVWVVDVPKEIEALVAVGVDGIMSDRPSVLARVLERLGVRWGRPCRG